MPRKLGRPAQVVILTIPFLVSILRAAEPITIEIAAGSHERFHVPVFFDLPESLRAHKHFELARLDPGQPVQLPVQLEQTNPPRLVWLVEKKLAAGATRRYRLTPVAEKPSDQPSSVRCADDGRALLLSVGDHKVLAYNHATVEAADRKESYYDRSGFLHPVFSPSGRLLTDNLSPDHKHQHGIMFPWRQCTFEGHTVDFWHEKLQIGKTEHAGIEDTGGGPVFTHFTARLRHKDISKDGTGKTVLNETWRVRVYNLTDAFLFDLESVQTCATASPLIVKKFDYGGMAIRGSRQWSDPAICGFLISEGQTRKNGNNARARWCVIHGQLDGKPAGLTTLCHPQNFRFPQPVRLHPTMPYYCWAPMILDEFRIEPGKPFVTRYRFIAFDGKVAPDSAERLWQDYANPVKVRVIANP